MNRQLGLLCLALAVAMAGCRESTELNKADTVGSSEAQSPTNVLETNSGDMGLIDGRTLGNPIVSKVTGVPQATILYTGVVPGAKIVVKIEQSTTGQYFNVIPLKEAGLEVAEGIPKLNSLPDLANAVRATGPLGVPVVLASQSPQRSVRFLSHYAVNFNPAFGLAPFTVGSAGDCASATKGTVGSIGAINYAASKIDCYRLIIVAAPLVSSLDSIGNPLLKLDGSPIEEFEPMQAQLAVAVDRQQQPPKVVAANFILQGGQQTAFVNIMPKGYDITNPLTGFEVTSTADSRLVVFAIHSKPISGAIERPIGDAFIFNPRPWDPLGWSAPRSLVKLAEFANNKLICLDPLNTSSAEDLKPTLCPTSQIVSFKQYFPLSNNPLKLDNGQPLTSDDVRCAYMWITPNGSDLFCQMIFRSGFSVIGSRTNGTYKLIDGFFNRQRSFQDCGIPNAVCPGQTLVQTLGASSGMWPITSSWVDAAKNPILPITRRLPSQSIVLFEMKKGRSVYGEVAFDEYMDRNYLLYLHMNESVRPSQTKKDINGAYSFFEYDYSPNGITPDTSGFYNNAAFSQGAGFYPELYYSSLNPRPPHKDFLNADSGFIGRAAYFPDRGLLTVTPNTLSGSSQLNLPFQTANISFALKILADFSQSAVAGEESSRIIAQKAGSWEIRLTAQRQLIISVWIRGQKYQSLPIGNLPISSNPLDSVWSHISLNLVRSMVNQISSNEVRVFINGEFQGTSLKIASASSFDSSNANIVIGADVNPGQNTREIAGIAILAIDEFTISRMARSREQIAIAAQVPFQVTDFVSGAENLSVEIPLGLDKNEIRLPISVTPYLSNDAIFSLGEKLFADVNLSRDSNSQSQGISCQTCHDPARAFTDGKQFAVGKSQGNRNTPTILNRAFSTKQFLDGRAKDVQTQALMPITNQREMNADMSAVLAYLTAKYAADFSVAFAAAPQLSVDKKLAIALSVFELRQLSGNSNVDQLLYSNAGDILTPGVTKAVVKGKQVFEGKGRCIGCHSGTNFSDELFHNTGVSFSTSLPVDLGRYLVTSSLSDMNSFKTPTLRNLCQTMPYFHDGSVLKLSEVIAFYNSGGGHAKGDLSTDVEMMPLGLSAQEQKDLLLFLTQLSASPTQINCN